MVQTTSIIKRHKKLVAVYVFILFSIGIALAAGIYIVLKEVNLQGDIDQVYSELTAKRANQILLLNAKNEQFKKEQADLSDLKSLLKIRDQLETLSSINSDMSDLLDSIIKIDAELSDLRLSPQDRDYVEEVVLGDLERVELNDLYYNYIQSQINLNAYYIATDSTNDCFSAIDYDEKNDRIIKAINKCILKIDEQYNVVTYHPDRLEKTFEYLNILKEYWTKHAELYSAIEKQDETEAKKLQKEIDEIDIQKEKLQQESSTEIGAWIERELSEIKDKEAVVNGLD